MTLLLAPRKAYILKNKTFRAAKLDFWRSAENFKALSANYKWYVGVGMMWAVSQAAPLRRIEVGDYYFMNMSHLFHRLDIRVVAILQTYWFETPSVLALNSSGLRGLYNWWMARGSWNMVFVV